MTETRPFDIVIRGCTVLTGEPDQGVIDNAVIGIHGDRLALIAHADEAEPVAAHRVIDARGYLATPGFINTHTHAVLSFARGMTEDAGFAPAYTRGVPHAYDVREDEAVALARVGALEALLFGSTLINDMYVHADATLPAVAELGIRISTGGWLHDVDFEHLHDRIWDYRPSIGERTLREVVDLADRWHGTFDGRASVMLAPHATDTCSRDFLREVDRERKRMNVRVMTHLAQSNIEVAQVRHRDSMTPTEVLEDSGLLDRDLIAAHCLVMTETDIARAGRAAITVAHAPKVNMTSGYRPVTSALRRAGATVALATDNMHGDMIETMRWALAAGRLEEAEISDFWQSRGVFHMATLGAATSMGRDHDLGSLTVGKKADVVLVDFRHAHLTPSLDPFATLVHVAQGRDVGMVIIDGRIVVEDGHPTLVDEERIRREAACAAKRLWDRVGANAHRSGNE